MQQLQSFVLESRGLSRNLTRDLLYSTVYQPLDEPLMLGYECLVWVVWVRRWERISIAVSRILT